MPYDPERGPESGSESGAAEYAAEYAEAGWPTEDTLTDLQERVGTGQLDEETALEVARRLGIIPYNE
jgi:hypothetical protein